MLNQGEKIGEWVVERTLGEGGMGAVFLCHSEISQRIKAAVKVMKPHGVGDAKKRFVRELELLAALRHPAVVQVFGGGHDERRDLLYMAMEFLEGEELKDRLARGPLEWSEAVRYFQQLGDGLRFAHEHGVVHRDIKPQNIMITNSGQAKLLDFGIAMQSGGTQLTRQGTVPGTIAYMAPEVFEGMKPDHRADIYALGLVLWETLTGREAYPEEGGTTPQQAMVQIMGKKLASASLELDGDFPPALQELVRRCTDPEPESRLHEMGEFVSLIGRSDEVELPRRGDLRAAAVPAPRRRMWLVLGGTGVAAALLAVVVVVLVVALAIAVPMVMAPRDAQAPPSAPPAVAPPSTPTPPPEKATANASHDKIIAKLPITLQNGATVTTAGSSLSGDKRVLFVRYDIQREPAEIFEFYRDQFKARDYGIASDVTSFDARSDESYTLTGMKSPSELVNVTVERARGSKRAAVSVSAITPER